MRYAVVLAGGERPPVPELAKALSEALSVPVPDYALKLRRARGLIELDCEEDAAKREAEALTAAGARAVAVPAGLLEEAPAATPVHAFDAKPRGRALAAVTFKQSRARVISADSGPGKRALQLGLSLATGLPLVSMGFGKKPPKVVAETDDVSYLDLVCEDPAARLRVAAHDFDFSCLGERMGFDAPGNFRRLLEWLSPGCERLGDGARTLLDGKPMRELAYESLEDLDREVRWLLTLRALKL